MKPGKYLLALLTLFALNAQAVEADKLSHFGGSTAISFVSYSLLKDTEYPVAYSIGITAAIGIAGEWHDRNRSGHFSKGDLAADLAGAVVGAYLGKGFYYLNKQLVYKKEF